MATEIGHVGKDLESHRRPQNGTTCRRNPSQEGIPSALAIYLWSMALFSATAGYRLGLW